jgi:membrane protein DedA with SNARE-associated domain
MGSLNIFLIILLGTLGSLIGASINYSIGYYFGRKYLLKNKKLFFLNIKHLKKTEYFFKKYGKLATFTGRLIPVIKQYISLPAGFSSMNYFDFIVYTFLGSFLWVTFLAIIGYKLGQEISKIILNYFNIVVIISICIFVLVVAFIYFLKKIK